MPRVSVVMSVYNGEAFLSAAVESVLAQEYRDFEFVIVNDGSTDGTYDLLRKHEATDSRIRVIDQANTGLTVALRNGCAAATAEFIARHDADDWSHPLRLQRAVEILDEFPQAVMASSWAKSVDELGDVVEKYKRPYDAEVATRLLLYEGIGPPGHGSVTFRRSAYEAVGGYQACFYYAQDYDLWHRLGEVGQIAYVPAYDYQYRLSPEAISGSHTTVQRRFANLADQCFQARQRNESEQVFLELAQTLRQEMKQNKPAASKLRMQRAAANYRIGTGLSRLGNPRAKQYFWTAIRQHPLHWRSWMRLALEFVSVGDSN